MKLSQVEVKNYIDIEKHRVNEDEYVLPKDNAIGIKLECCENKELFLLDVNLKYISYKVTFQNRVKSTIVLVRLDIGSHPHMNPNNEKLPSSHLHVYKEGFADKFAYRVPDCFTDLEDFETTYNQFAKYCNITKPPHISKGLF